MDRVIIGTCNLASAILNFAESLALDKMQYLIQFNLRWVLQLINYISNDLKKLLKYVDGTTIFVSFTELFALWTVFAALCLTDWELIVKSTLLFGTSFLLNYHKLLDVSE